MLADGTHVLFVGNLHSSVSADELRDAFSKCGTVSNVVVRGPTGMVYMASGGILAHDTMQGERVGRARVPIRVEWARSVSGAQPPNTTLYVKGYASSTTDEQLAQHFGQAGTIIRLHRASDFAFIEYATLEEATRAHNQLNGSTLGSRTLVVEYARPDNHQSYAPAPITPAPAAPAPAASAPAAAQEAQAAAEATPKAETEETKPKEEEKAAEPAEATKEDKEEPKATEAEAATETAEAAKEEQHTVNAEAEAEKPPAEEKAKDEQQEGEQQQQTSSN